MCSGLLGERPHHLAVGIVGCPYACSTPSMFLVAQGGFRAVRVATITSFPSLLTLAPSVVCSSNQKGDIEKTKWESAIHLRAVSASLWIGPGCSILPAIYLRIVFLKWPPFPAPVVIVSGTHLER